MATKTVLGNVVTAVTNNIAKVKTAIGNATTSAAGLMSSADKTKLDGVATGANKTTIVNNLTATTAGSALDATQGKALSDKITSLNDSLTNYSSYTITDSYGSIDVVKLTFGKISIYSFSGKYTADISIYTVRYIDKDSTLQSKLKKTTVLSEHEGYQTSYAFSGVDENGIYTAPSGDYATGRNFYGICIAFYQ